MYLLHLSESRGMLLIHDTESPVPIWKQIVTQVICAVAAGEKKPGDLIPSVREIASQMVVHPNTVARAFQVLEQAGIVTARRGKGMEVTREAPRLCEQRRRDTIQSRVRQVLREAVASGLPPGEIRQVVEEELAPAEEDGREPEIGIQVRR
jgi:GntR family transcriptional regulator